MEHTRSKEGGDGRRQQAGAKRLGGIDGYECESVTSGSLTLDKITFTTRKTLVTRVVTCGAGRRRPVRDAA